MRYPSVFFLYRNGREALYCARSGSELVTSTLLGAKAEYDNESDCSIARENENEKPNDVTAVQTRIIEKE